MKKLIIVLQLILIVGVFALMERRDAEAREIEHLEQIIRLDSECAPPFELSMPIDPARVKL